MDLFVDRRHGDAGGRPGCLILARYVERPDSEEPKSRRQRESGVRGHASLRGMGTGGAGGLAGFDARRNSLHLEILPGLVVWPDSGIGYALRGLGAGQVALAIPPGCSTKIRERLRVLEEIARERAEG